MLTLTFVTTEAGYPELVGWTPEQENAEERALEHLCREYLNAHYGSVW